MTDPDLSGNFLVNAIHGYYTPGFNHFRYRVTVIDQTRVATWLQFWESLTSTSNAPAVAASSVDVAQIGPIASWAEITVTHAMSPYTMDGTVQFIHCDTSAGAVVINCNAAASFPLDYYAIDKATGDANTATVNAAAGESFPEGASITLSAQNGQPGGVYAFAPKH
jgi:hypothetical protein